MKTSTLRTIAATAALLLMASISHAGARSDYKSIHELVPTRQGEAVQASGWVSMGRGNGIEFFGVRVMGDFQDGDQLIVSVETSKGVIDVGAIKMFLGSGKLYLEASDEVSGVFPLANVQGVFVHDKSGMLLTLNLVP